ncbi:hypothetical protein [Methyloversatilis sp.]|uniref:hypothetical protein n=1 Tax=Methyloversatilis sp. TaxID=2569862 RepID=UPI0027355CF8|nr:hypothetical protein [Methyloversatilis sp.]
MVRFLRVLTANRAADDPATASPGGRVETPHASGRTHRRRRRWLSVSNDRDRHMPVEWIYAGSGPPLDEEAACCRVTSGACA